MTKDATMVAAKRELVDRERGCRIGGMSKERVQVIGFSYSWDRAQNVE